MGSHCSIPGVCCRLAEEMLDTIYEDIMEKEGSARLQKQLAGHVVNSEAAAAYSDLQVQVLSTVLSMGVCAPPFLAFFSCNKRARMHCGNIQQTLCCQTSRPSLVHVKLQRMIFRNSTIM